MKRNFMISFLSRGLATAIAVVMLGNLPILSQSFSQLAGGQAQAAQPNLVAQTSTRSPAPSKDSLTADVVKTV